MLWGTGDSMTAKKLRALELSPGCGRMIERTVGMVFTQTFVFTCIEHVTLTTPTNLEIERCRFWSSDVAQLLELDPTSRLELPRHAQ